MPKPSDQALAQKLLKLKLNGFPWKSFLKRIIINYIFLYVCSVAFALLCAKEFCPSRTVLYVTLFFCLGFCLGAILRDFNRFLSFKRIWPFTLKTTDWEKVESLAKECKIEKLIKIY